MSRWAAARLAWLLWLLFVLTEAASLSLRARNDPSTLVIDVFGALFYWAIGILIGSTLK